jgi:hypothetical protein
MSDVAILLLFILNRATCLKDTLGLTVTQGNRTPTWPRSLKPAGDNTLADILTLRQHGRVLRSSGDAKAALLLARNTTARTTLLNQNAVVF